MSSHSTRWVQVLFILSFLFFNQSINQSSSVEGGLMMTTAQYLSFGSSGRVHSIIPVIRDNAGWVDRESHESAVRCVGTVHPLLCRSDRVYGIRIGCGGVDAVRGVDVAMGTGDGDVNIIPLTRRLLLFVDHSVTQTKTVEWFHQRPWASWNRLGSSVRLTRITFCHRSWIQYLQQRTY